LPPKSPPTLPWIAKQIHPLCRMSPFPLLTPVLTEERQRLPPLVASGHHPTFAHPAHTTFPLSFSQMHRSKTQAHSYSQNTFPKTKATPNPKAKARSRKLSGQQSDYHESMPSSIPPLPTPPSPSSVCHRWVPMRCSHPRHLDIFVILSTGLNCG